MNKKFEMATVRVQRFNPDTDKKPYLQEFEVPTESDPTLLDLSLIHISEPTRQDTRSRMPSSA